MYNLWINTAWTHPCNQHSDKENITSSLGAPSSSLESPVIKSNHYSDFKHHRCFTCFCISHKWNHKVSTVFCLASLSKCNIHDSQPCCFIYCNLFILITGWYSNSEYINDYWWTFGVFCFSIWGYYEVILLWTFLYMSVGEHVSAFLLIIHARARLLNLSMCLCSAFISAATLFLK